MKRVAMLLILVANLAHGREAANGSAAYFLDGFDKSWANGFGAGMVRAVAYGLYGFGSDPTKPIGASAAFTRGMFGTGVDLSTFFSATEFGTLVGVDVSLLIGWTLKETPSDNGPLNDKRKESGGWFGKADAVMTFSPFHRFPIRLIFGPGLGIDADGARFGDVWQLALLLMGKVQFALGQNGVLNLIYTYVPGTAAKDWVVRHHRAEVSLTFGVFSIGARAQVDSWAQKDLAGTEANIGGFIGFVPTLAK